MQKINAIKKWFSSFVNDVHDSESEYYDLHPSGNPLENESSPFKASGRQEIRMSKSNTLPEESFFTSKYESEADRHLSQLPSNKFVQERRR